MPTGRRMNASERNGWVLLSLVLSCGSLGIAGAAAGSVLVLGFGTFVGLWLGAGVGVAMTPFALVATRRWRYAQAFWLTTLPTTAAALLTAFASVFNTGLIAAQSLPALLLPTLATYAAACLLVGWTSKGRPGLWGGPHACPHCGYDLRGVEHTGRCPECGGRFIVDTEPAAPI